MQVCIEVLEWVEIPELIWTITGMTYTKVKNKINVLLII